MSSGSSSCSTLAASSSVTMPWLVYRPSGTVHATAISAIGYSTLQNRLFFGDYDAGAIWSVNMSGGDQKQHAKFSYPVYIAEIPGAGLVYLDIGLGKVASVPLAIATPQATPTGTISAAEGNARIGSVVALLGLAFSVFAMLGGAGNY